MPPSPSVRHVCPGACFMNELSNFCKIPSLLRKQGAIMFITLGRNIDESLYYERHLTYIAELRCNYYNNRYMVYEVNH